VVSVERVAFLVEDTNKRIDCQLNPETVEVTRLAGLRPRGTATGRLTGAGMADDPLHFTGGGRTELRLDLLFDVELVPTEPRPTDVRALTRPLWMLAENSAVEHGTVRPPALLMVLGKSWNVRTVVAAVAERFDRFDAQGVPGRSWLRLKLLRVADTAAQAEEQFAALRSAQTDAQLGRSGAAGGVPTETVDALMVTGDGPVGGGAGGPTAPPVTRFDLLATDGLGDPFLWRLLARHNDIADPTTVAPGTVLAVPPVAGAVRAAASAAAAAVTPGAPVSAGPSAGPLTP
jgi:hypothetical protein